jgi:integrase
LTGVAPDTLTLGQVFTTYFRLKALVLSPEWRQLAETRRKLFEEAWGRDKIVQDVSQTDVDLYVRLRRVGELAPDWGGRKLKGVRDGTLAHDFSWLSSVFNWAKRHKVNGRRMLPDNPLHDTTWPREKNPRRPVASHQRFIATLEHVDAVDPEGRLRSILSLLRYTGRRLGAVCKLQANDVLRTPADVRAALASSGMDERIGEYMPHGAIRWLEEHDKVGLLSISPLSSPAREALDVYLRRSPRVGATPFFAASKDPGRPIRPDVVAKWLLRAEGAAGLPKLAGSVAHAYRRLWATERKTLPDVDVAATGGWKSTQALKLSYQHADPATALRVVENAGARRHIPDTVVEVHEALQS